MADSFAAIILAAGQSRRMGEFKPLLPLGESTVLEHGVALFRRSGIRDLRVVTGHEGDRLQDLLHSLQVPRVDNPRYREGMFTSIQAAVRTLPEGISAFFLLPVDIPLVRPSTVKTLLRAWHTGRQGIIQPVFNGIYGHPPLISIRYRDIILGADGEGGLKKLLRNFFEDTLELEISDEYVLLDMDTPEDYELLCHRWNRQGIPTEKECEHLLAHQFDLPRHTVEHCRQVARIAVRMVDELNRKGLSIDRELILAAGLLHDCVRSQPHHAVAGEKALRQLGFPEVGSVVGQHMDLSVSDDPKPSAAEILYLADKLIGGHHRLDLKNRFEEKKKRYAGQSEILDKIESRLQAALKIKGKLESFLGSSLEKVLTESENENIQQA
ncbi:MAG: NTP transferase domain-containing protein [Syntrophotaleaceae bacterium]